MNYWFIKPEGGLVACARTKESDSAPVRFAVYVDDANGNRTWNNNNGQNFQFSRM
jgi:hypothetical protein